MAAALVVVVATAVAVSIAVRAEILGGSPPIVLGRCGLILYGDFRLVVVAGVIAAAVVGRARRTVRNGGKVRLVVAG